MRDLALRLAPSAGAVANFCDHIEHNELATREWVLDAGKDMREAAYGEIIALGLSPIRLYADRLDEVEKRNVLYRPGAFDGRAAILVARSWRDLQRAQIDHDRHYHPDVMGLPRREQLRHFAFHMAKLVGAFSTDGPAAGPNLIHKRLPDTLLFGIKLWTVMGEHLSDDPLCEEAE